MASELIVYVRPNVVSNIEYAMLSLYIKKKKVIMKISFGIGDSANVTLGSLDNHHRYPLHLYWMNEVDDYYDFSILDSLNENETLTYKSFLNRLMGKPFILANEYALVTV